MRLPIGATIAAALALLAPAGASAATEIGDNCVGGETVPIPVGLTSIFHPANPLPTAVPAPGVLTKWRVNLVPVPAVLPHSLKVLRPSAVPETIQIVGESQVNVLGGANAFPARIPVQAGDRLGLITAGALGTLYCKAEGPLGVIGTFGAGTTGALSPFAQGPAPVRVPLAGTVEPDADSDGYGDETQDQCPQSALVQTTCPVVVLDAYPLSKKAKIIVYISTDRSASVTVSGTAKLPRSNRKTARSSAQAKLPKVTKVVEAGKITRFALNIPAKLRSAAAGLAKGKSLTVKLTATAPNLVGPATTDRAQVRLRNSGTKRKNKGGRK